MVPYFTARGPPAHSATFPPSAEIFEAGRVRRVEEPACLGRILQLSGEDVGLHHRKQVGAVDLEDPVEALHRQQHPAAHRHRAAGVSRAGAPDHEGDPLVVTEAGDAGNVLDSARDQHQVGSGAALEGVGPIGQAVMRHPPGPTPLPSR